MIDVEILTPADDDIELKDDEISVKYTPVEFWLERVGGTMEVISTLDVVDAVSCPEEIFVDWDAEITLVCPTESVLSNTFEVCAMLGFGSNLLV